MAPDLIYLLRKNYGERNVLQEEAADALVEMLAENARLREENKALAGGFKRIGIIDSEGSIYPEPPEPGTQVFVETHNEKVKGCGDEK